MSRHLQSTTLISAMQPNIFPADCLRQPLKSTLGGASRHRAYAPAPWQSARTSRPNHRCAPRGSSGAGKTFALFKSADLGWLCAWFSGRQVAAAAQRSRRNHGPVHRGLHRGHRQQSGPCSACGAALISLVVSYTASPRWRTLRRLSLSHCASSFSAWPLRALFVRPRRDA